jgi:PAS domain S-box-containing protein
MEDKTREQLIDELLVTRRQYELILNSAMEGIFGLDLNGINTFVNPAAAKMLGYDVEELIGKDNHQICHHSKLDGSPYPKEKCPIYSTLLYGTCHHIRDEVFWKKDGSSLQVAYNSTPIIEEGNIIGTVVTFWDISERNNFIIIQKRLINELKNSITKIKTLTGLLPICSYCKKIRDDEGYWQKLEKYICDHSTVEFSQGICPDCLKEHKVKFEQLKEDISKK